MRKTKLLVLLCVTVLMLVSLLAIGSAAEEKVLKIDSANVAYNDMMHLVFTLENTDLVPEGAEAGIIVWDKAQDEFLVSNARFATFTQYSDGKTPYYKSYGVAAPQIGTEIYIAACYIADEVITVTQTPVSYSLIEYFVSRLNQNVEDYQAELYESVLTYGAASDKVLADNAFVLVRAAGGYVGSYNRAVGASKEIGESFMLRAQVKDHNGDFFTKWVDKNGNTISTDRVCNVTPETAGIASYTAVYGGEASYKSGFGFEDLATGEVDLGTPDLTKLTTTTCYNGYSSSNMRRWSLKYTGIPNVTLQFYALPKATLTDQKDAAGNKIFEFEKDANGNYILGLKDSVFVTEKSNGDKEMAFVRGIDKAAGYDTTFENPVSGCMTAEIDLGYEKFTDSGVHNHFNIYVYDGTEGASYRFNINLDAKAQSGSVYAEKAKAGIADDNEFKVDGKLSTFSVKPGEKVTISVTLNTSGETPCFDMYYDGAYAGSLDCSIFGVHNTKIDFSKAKVSSIGIKAVSAATATVVFDNVCFK